LAYPRCRANVRIRIVAVLAAAAIALIVATMMTGCGKEESISALSPDLEQMVIQYGEEETLTLVKEAVAEEKSAKNYERLAQAYTLNQKPEETIEALRKALELDPNYPRAVIGMAVVKLSQKDYAAAQELAERLLDQHSRGYAEGQLAAARAMLGQEKAQESYDLLQVAVKQHPKYAALFYALGDTALMLKKNEEAENAYRKAAQLDPQQRRYQQALMVALVKNDKVDEAIGVAQDAQRINADNPLVHFVAGSVYSYAGHTEDAMLAYEEALMLEPRFAPAANNLAITLADSGEQLTRAEELATQALRQEPGNHAYADTLAWVWIRAGKYDKGLELLSKVRDQWPESIAVKYHLGYALVKTGKIAEGKVLLKQVAANEARLQLAKSANEMLDELAGKSRDTEDEPAP
jgi:tetratricopeptide (TPR) repeat protein